VTLAPALAWVLLVLIEVNSGRVADDGRLADPPVALTAAAAEFATRHACEMAGGAVRWTHRDRPGVLVSFTCAARE
jgi:hypothetical protein